MPISINGSGTITGLSAGGLPDGSIITADLADDAVTATKIGTKTFVSYAVICDQKTASTQGGTFSAGAWRTRDLNTEIFDPDGIVSISSNQFTLSSAGTYLIEWSCPAMRSNYNMARLYDVTGAAVVQDGQGAFSDTGADGDQSNSNGWARVTIASSNTYRIEHRCQTGESTRGFGIANGFGVEIYAVVAIYKEA